MLRYRLPFFKRQRLIFSFIAGVPTKIKGSSLEAKIKKPLFSLLHGLSIYFFSKLAIIGTIILQRLGTRCIAKQLYPVGKPQGAN